MEYGESTLEDLACQKVRRA